ncbi:MAG: nucleotidyltransferase domain-containing protein [Flavobacteriales bacterium]|nr:nucleotidyltransferase domain-containing protein [Flavobacteriales bacterium]
MDEFGAIIRKLRKEKGLPLRAVSAYLDMDQAILSKIERGHRTANREQVLKLAEFFQINENELLVSWLSDKLLYEIADEEMALKALQAAEEKVGYRYSTVNLPKLIEYIKEVLKKDGRVATAWLFGSIVTHEVKPESDVDIMVEFKEDKKYSMFDLLDIAFKIETAINRKVDLVEKGHLKDFALKTANKNLQKIYG